MSRSPFLGIPRMKLFATSSFLLQLILLIPNSSASNQGLNDELRFIHREIGQLRDENHNQNREIAMLKDMMAINQNNNKTNSNQNAKLIEESLAGPRSLSRRIQRPIRLLPPYLFRNEPRNETDQHRFYGPPTNCSDLSHLGYTLNGFYLVQSITNNADDGLKTETVYCAFKQPDGHFNQNAVEKRVTAITSSKFDDAPSSRSSNSGVHFHVQTTSAQRSVESMSKIPFKNVILNMGDGFDTETELFTVPKSGIYQFTFSGSMYSNTAKREKPVNILLSVNDLKQRYSMQVVDNLLINRVLQVIIRLNREDKISVHIQTTQGRVDYLDICTFSGSLLEEIVD